MRKFFFWLIAVIAGAVAGCSGQTGTAPTAARITGVAAAGSPLQGTVYLKDATFHDLSAAIADDGSFSFDVTGLAKPFLLKASGSANGKSYVLYSVAREGGNANINPLSNLVTAKAAGGDPGAVFDAPNRAAYPGLAAGLATSLNETQAALGDVLKAFDVAAVNPITSLYFANHTGLDRLFDFVTIDAGNGQLTVTNNLNDATILDAPLTAMTTATTVTANIPRVSGTAPHKWHLKRSTQETTDAVHNVVETSVTSYSYDTAGNVILVAESVTTPGTTSPATSFTSYDGFDAHGNPASFTGSQDTGTMAYQYDAGGRIASKSGIETVTFSTGRGYYTMNYTSTYAYNPDGSYEVKTSSTKIYGTGLEVPVSETREYDSRGNLLTYSSNGERIISYTYLYDSNGNTVTANFVNSDAGTRGHVSYVWQYF